jgi:hypothetical protein
MFCFLSLSRIGEDMGSVYLPEVMHDNMPANNHLSQALFGAGAIPSPYIRTPNANGLAI